MKIVMILIVMMFSLSAFAAQYGKLGDGTPYCEQNGKRYACDSHGVECDHKNKSCTRNGSIANYGNDVGEGSQPNTKLDFGE
jgi:hypothetical protein